MFSEQRLPQKQKRSSTLISRTKTLGMYQGILLTFMLALLADSLASLPFLSILGIMIIAILLGMAWKASMDVPANASAGITFSSKYILRGGIVLLGVRLNLVTIADMGISILVIDVVVITATLLFVVFIGKVMNVDRDLTLLIGTGTAICGAAAIVAVAPILKGSDKKTPLAVACIAILGTVGAIGYIVLFPWLDLSNETYGILVGATLHELAHVVAAAVPGGDISSDAAIVVKLGRVLMLVPAALLLSLFLNKSNTERTRLKDIPFPWFVLGFLAVSILNTLGFFSVPVQDFLTSSSVYLMAMGMAGLGLSMNVHDFQKAGFRPVIVGIAGSIFIVGIGILLVVLI
ncbi:YeiH family protein [Salibacterium halotolerans]|uniref:Conserved hypothetical integral membrane protein n=1 Tax=Salibacterium halotolerans TaxID=1884432 RepID=A0A1I5LCH7_9BACI|nr:YeiH family protein [Salibacterium halotolerans]SFO94905.1 conserved hypothetical integral membrane protein [Salibacterium halotolerans]